MALQYARDQPEGFKNRLEKVAIVGAGGQIGTWIVEELVKNKNITLTAITREGSSNAICPGIEVIKVNYEDKASLVNALKGQDCLVITMGVTAPEDTSKKLFEAAAEAGVPWMLPNEWGGDGKNEAAGRDVLIGPRKLAERKLIESLGVSSWVGIACGFWYDFSLGGGVPRYGFDFKKKELTWFDDGSVKLCTSTFPQTARATAAVLGLKILPEDETDKSPCLSDYRNKFANVSSFYVNQKDMFESVLRVTGDKADDWKQKTVKIQDWYAEGQQILKTGSRSGFGQMLYSRAFFPDAPGDSSDRLQNERLGLPKEDLDEFTQKAIDIALGGYHEKRYGGHFKAEEDNNKAGTSGSYQAILKEEGYTAK